MTQLIVRASDISSGWGALKFTKTRKILQNSVEISPNTCLNNIFETYLCKQRPETTRWDYVAKNWALAIMLKALPLVYLWSVLFLKEQIMTSVRKNVKNAGLISVKPIDLTKFSLKMTAKSAFFTDWFSATFAPKNPTKFDFLSMTYQKSCTVWHDPSNLKIWWIEVGINLEVKWLCLCDLAHFLWRKQSKISLGGMFVLTLLF